MSTATKRQYRPRNVCPEIGARVRCECEPVVYGVVVRHHDRERWSLVRTSYGTAWWPWRDLREVAA